MKLTQHNIAKIALPHGKSEIIQFDSSVPGFGLRIRAGGSRQWIFQYRIGSKQRRLTLGSATAINTHDARESAGKLYARVRLGQDPAAEKAESQTKVAETFGSILKPYLVRKKAELKPRSYQEAERHLVQHGKRLHGMQIDAIDRRTIAALLSALATNSGPSLANSVRASLSGFFSWAMREGLAQANPVIGTNKAAANGSRDRVLDDRELALIWSALPDNDFGDAVRLLALLGLRRDEVGGLRWAEIDFGKALIELPPERTKNSRAHLIPLAPMALDILKTRPRLAGSECIFGTGANGLKGWSNYKVTLDAAIAAKGVVGPWRLHDLRRTFSTRLHDELGIAPHVVEELLGHVSGHKSGVAGVYNKAQYSKEKAIALARWAEHLTAIVTGKDSKVVAISKGAAPR